MKRLVNDLMKQLDLTRFPVVTPQTSVSKAVEQMWAYDSGAVLVVDRGSVSGIFSDRDFLKMSANARHAIFIEQSIETHMTREVLYVTTEYSLEECLIVMSEKNLRNLPVLVDSQPIALLCQGHITSVLVKDKQHMIDELTQYISGSSTLASRGQTRSARIVESASISP